MTARAHRRCRHPALVLVPLVLTWWVASSPSSAFAAASVPVPAPNAVAPTYPTLYVTALRDALAAKSFHEVQTIVSSGYTSVDNEDASQNGGTETDSIRSASASFAFTVRLYNARLYLNADQLTLVNVVGLSAFDGGYNAGRWLVVPHSSKVYDELADGIDVVSGVAQIELESPVTVVGPTTYHGRPAIALKSNGGLHASATQGAEPGSFTLYVTTGPHPLPLAEVLSDKIGKTAQRATLEFSQWNHPVTITKPTRSIPLP